MVWRELSTLWILLLSPRTQQIHDARWINGVFMFMFCACDCVQKDQKENFWARRLLWTHFYAPEFYPP